MGIRNSSSEMVGDAHRAQKRGMVLPFQSLSLAFNHVNYYVDMPAVSCLFLSLLLFSIWKVFRNWFQIFNGF